MELCIRCCAYVLYEGVVHVSHFYLLIQRVVLGGKNMKRTHKVERFDYSKVKSMAEYEYWGIHPKNGRLHIDTKRYKKACEEVGIEEFIPSGLFGSRNTVYFEPKKISRYDYKVNYFIDLINDLKHDWLEEYKPIFAKIKTPSEVEESSKLEALAYTSFADDYDEICIDATMEGFRRTSKYNEIINALYCQFISKICTEADRFTLIVMCELGFKGTDFSTKSFFEFSDGLLKQKGSIKIENLKKYNAYNMLHKINNFLKHNSLAAYKTLEKFYPYNVIKKKNGQEYQNGMFAGDWIKIEPNYIDKIFDKLILFFKDYCSVFLGENVEDAEWNYDDYFKMAYKEMSHPDIYFGI